MLANRALADFKFICGGAEGSMAHHHFEGAQRRIGQVEDHISCTNSFHYGNQLDHGPVNRDTAGGNAEGQMSTVVDSVNAAQKGAENMLVNCAGAQPGERLLIAYESPEFGYYDADAVACVQGAARALSLKTKTYDVGFSPDNPLLGTELKEQFERADIILFLARLGDQLRFSDMPVGKRIVVSFALDAWMFGTAFGNTHHGAMLRLKNNIAQSMDRAQEVHVTCRRGTDFRGKPVMNLNANGDTSVLRFPMSVFAPVPAFSFSGRVALCGFLTGTGSPYYDDYTLEFDKTLLAIMENGRLMGFEGDPAHVAAANAHYDRVAGKFGIERNFVHSWHAGMHPGCGYTRPARNNYERWGGSSFGNPRILHFHTCGTYAPGEISWNVIDPTIRVDGVPVWQDGVFHADRLRGGQDILDRFPCAARAFKTPERRIGLPEFEEAI